MVAPNRCSAPWYAEMTSVLADQPWMVPQFWGPLSQEGESPCTPWTSLFEFGQVETGRLSVSVIQTICECFMMLR